MASSHQCGIAAASRAVLSVARSVSRSSGYLRSTVASASFAGSPWAAWSTRSCSAKFMSPSRSEELSQDASLAAAEIVSLPDKLEREVRLVLTAKRKPLIGRGRHELKGSPCD